MNIQVIIEGHARGHDMRHYQSYLDHMWQQTDTNDPLKQFAKGYEDFLQVFLSSFPLKNIFFLFSQAPNEMT